VAVKAEGRHGPQPTLLWHWKLTGSGNRCNSDAGLFCACSTGWTNRIPAVRLVKFRRNHEPLVFFNQRNGRVSLPSDAVIGLFSQRGDGAAGNRWPSAMKRPISSLFSA
jgi:hypothetical protein